jgi:hypothetical protein
MTIQVITPIHLGEGFFLASTAYVLNLHIALKSVQDREEDSSAICMYPPRWLELGWPVLVCTHQIYRSHWPLPMTRLDNEHAAPVRTEHADTIHAVERVASRVLHRRYMWGALETLNYCSPAMVMPVALLFRSRSLGYRPNRPKLLI